MRIKIGKNSYEILECLKIEKRNDNNDSDNSLILGDTDFLKKSIAIVVDTNVVCKSEIKKIIVHELTHAYMYEHSVNNHWISAIEKGYEEEKICDFFATFGEDIIRDSEKIYKNIFEKEKK